MSEEIVIALITAVGTIVGIIIGSLLATLKPDQKWVVVVVTIVGGVSGFLLGMLLAQARFPEVPESVSFHEGFDNPTYNNQYNTTLWYCNNCDSQERRALQQAEGLRFEVLRIGASNSLELRSRSTWTRDRVVSLEGKLKFDENSESGGIWLAIGGANCFLRVAESSSRRLVFQCGFVKQADPSSPEEWQYSTEELPADFGAWYTMRIDFRTTTNQLSFYLDGRLVGQYTPGNPDSTVEVRVGSWTDTSNTVTYVDDIILTVE